jgi:hypothetical protein
MDEHAVEGEPLDLSLEVPGGSVPTNMGPAEVRQLTGSQEPVQAKPVAAPRATRRKGGEGAQGALDWGRSLVGLTESPANSNKGPRITQWEVDSGYPWVPNAAQGVPWCQCYANAVAVHGGCPQLHTGYTPAVLSGIGNYKPISLNNASPGDFVFFKWPGVSSATCDHVGVHLSHTDTTVTCLEGNTSSSNAGSQNNGGGVWIKTRSRSLVAGAVNVPYANSAYRNLLLGMTGDDVRAFQVATNKRADGCNRQDRKCDVDGAYGPETKDNGAWAAWLLGVGDSTDEIKSGGISAYVQNLVRNPDQRNDVQVARAAERRKVACR